MSAPDATAQQVRNRIGSDDWRYFGGGARDQNNVGDGKKVRNRAHRHYTGIFDMLGSHRFLHVLTATLTLGHAELVSASTLQPVRPPLARRRTLKHVPVVRRRPASVCFWPIRCF